MPLEALQQALGLLEASLAHAQVREPDQREDALAAIAALERPHRGEQLLLRLGPAADRDQDPAVVSPAGRRHEVASTPRDRSTAAIHSSARLTSTRVRRRSTAGSRSRRPRRADDLARGDRGHRLVEQPHPLGHAPATTYASPSRASASNSRSQSPNRRAIASAADASRSRSTGRAMNGARSSVSQPCAAHSSTPSSSASRAPGHPPAGGGRCCRGPCRGGTPASARRRRPPPGCRAAGTRRTPAPSARSRARTDPGSGPPRPGRRAPRRSRRAPRPFSNRPGALPVGCGQGVATVVEEIIDCGLAHEPHYPPEAQQATKRRRSLPRSSSPDEAHCRASRSLRLVDSPDMSRDA